MSHKAYIQGAAESIVDSVRKEWNRHVDNEEIFPFDELEETKRAYIIGGVVQQLANMKDEG